MGGPKVGTDGEHSGLSWSIRNYTEDPPPFTLKIILAGNSPVVVEQVKTHDKNSLTLNSSLLIVLEIETDKDTTV